MSLQLMSRENTAMQLRKFLVLSLFLPLTAMADGASGQQIISSFAVDTKNQLVWIAGATAWGNPDGCGTSNIVAFQFSNTYYKDLLSEVTTAYAAGKSVAFGLSGCFTSPLGNTPVAVAIVLY